VCHVMVKLCRVFVSSMMECSEGSFLVEEGSFESYDADWRGKRASKEAMMALRLVERGVRGEVCDVGDSFRTFGCFEMFGEGACMDLRLWWLWVEGGGLRRLAASRVR